MGESKTIELESTLKKIAVDNCMKLELYTNERQELDFNGILTEMKSRGIIDEVTHKSIKVLLT